MFKVPEKHRVKEGGNYKSSSLDGNNGLFLIPMSFKRKDNEKPFNYYLSVITTDSQGWEMIVISIMNKDGKLTPRHANTDEVAFLINLFWGKEDTVYQFHPGEKDKDMGTPPFSIIIWRPKFLVVPRPPVNFKTFPHHNEITSKKI